MRCLLTGGAGFIGSHLAERLLDRGERVICLDDFNDFYDPRIKRANIQKLLENPSFRLIEADITDGRRMKEGFKKESIDILIHLAARAGVRPSIKNPRLYFKVNLEGTVHLLECCRDFGVKKMIFASSSSVYGNNQKVPFSETDPVDNPISPYAATKKGGELLCYTYHHLYHMDISCLRFFTVFGPRQRPEMAIHLFTDLMAHGKEILMYGDGSTSRDYTYIDDIIDGVIRAMDRLNGYHIYNLGGSSPVSLKELIDTISAALGCPPKIKVTPMQPGDVERTYADLARSSSELGFRPHVSLEDGISRFISWYRDKKMSL